MKVSRTLTLLSAFLLVLPAAPAIAAPVCESLFSERAYLTPESRLLNESQMRRQVNLSQSTTEDVLVTDSDYAFHLGGRLRLVMTKTGRWGSEYSESDNDPIGNPQSLPLTVGPKAAWNLGFRSISATAMTIPDADALDAVIRKANTMLATRGQPLIPITFYQVDVHKPLLGREYLERFVQGQIPLEKSGSLALHDISFHAGTFLLPPELIARMKASAKLALALSDRLREKNIHEFDEAADRLIESANTRIDFLGLLPDFIAHHVYHRAAPVRAIETMLKSNEWTLRFALMGISSRLDARSFLELLIADAKLSPATTMEVRKILETIEIEHQPKYSDAETLSLIQPRINQIRAILEAIGSDSLSNKTRNIGL